MKETMTCREKKKRNIDKSNKPNIYKSNNNTNNNKTKHRLERTETNERSV